MNTPALREQCAQQLRAAGGRVADLKAFVGLDGFVDEILHVVDKRESPEKYTRLPTIAQFAARLAGAAGQSTNVELVSMMKKLGGNGPIMGNALASMGLKVSYLGNLGHPAVHPVFADFTQRADVTSIAEPGYTDALEFEDGKIMLGKHQFLKDVNWANIGSRFGVAKLTAKLQEATFVAFVNWTMLTYMNDIWAAIQKEVCPALTGPKRTLFIDLADPEKRTQADILRALELILAFEKHFNVILGLNTSDHSPAGLARLGQEILTRTPVGTVVIHPTAYALAVSKDGVATVEGPFTPKPLITTGAGDHFNAGFCLGKLLGLSNELAVLTGVSTSGYYVRTAKSPAVPDLVGLLQNWPTS